MYQPGFELIICLALSN